MAAPVFDVFISYRAHDADAATSFAAGLRRYGLRPWLDRWHVAPGHQLRSQLYDAIDASASFVYVAGTGGMGAWAWEELYYAQERAARDPGFRIMLAILPGVADVDVASLAPIRWHARIDLRRPLREAQQVRKLANAILVAPWRRGTLGPGVGPDIVNPSRTQNSADQVPRSSREAAIAKAEAELDLVTSRLRAELQARHPELFDEHGQLRTEAATAGLLKRTGGKIKLSDDDLIRLTGGSGRPPDAARSGDAP